METVETFDYSGTFLKGQVNGIGYAHPVEWRTPPGDTIAGSVLINGRLTIVKLYAKKEMQPEEFFPWHYFLGIMFRGPIY